MHHETEAVLDLGELGQIRLLIDFTYTPPRPARFCTRAEAWLPGEEEDLEILDLTILRSGTARPLPGLRRLSRDLAVPLEAVLRDRLIEAVTL